MKLLNAARNRDRVWTARYQVRGAVRGAMREVEYWTDGESTRAQDALGTLWLTGPAGTFIAHPSGDELWLESGASALYEPPFPELEGIRSTQAAAVWLDSSLADSDPQEAIMLGRRAVRHTSGDLEIVEDDETGLVLFVTTVGLRGRMSLQVTSQSWVNRDRALFAKGRRSVV